MIEAPKGLPDDQKRLWGLFDQEIIDTLSDGETTFLREILATINPPYLAKYSVMMDFRNSKTNERIANIQLDASKRAENAAEATKEHSKKMHTLTVVIAIAAGVQAAIAIASMILK